MSFWSVAGPVATIGASAFGGPAAGMAVGALTSSMAAQERRKEMMERQQRTANAAADAQRVSYGRKDGRGFVPEVQYAEGTSAGDQFGATVAGGMQGYSMGKQFGAEGPDWMKMKQDQNLYGYTGGGQMPRSGASGISSYR